MSKIKKSELLIIFLIALVSVNIFISLSLIKNKQQDLQKENHTSSSLELNWQPRNFIKSQSINNLLPLLFGGSKKKIVVKSNSILELKLNKPISERKADNPLEQIMQNPLMPYTPSLSLIDIKENIEKAKNDKKIKGILLNLSDIPAGFATVSEIRSALIHFKKSDKLLIAYGNNFSEKAFLLASIADEIILNPMGTVEWNGLSMETMFFTGAMEKLGVKAEIFRVGKYKSAVEPFMRKNMSDASKEQTLSFANAIYENNIIKIARSRNLSKDTLRKIANQYLVRNAKDALNQKLITKIGYFDEVEEIIKEKIEVEKDFQVRLIGLKDYNQVPEADKKEDNAQKIAVIIAEGEIVSGRGIGENVITDQGMVEAIRKAKNDNTVKGIVLRINSPGGSALASDIIWREIQLCKKVKPVVASMSDVAASGGYYIAMAADKIYASPNTITGSIGVFGLLLNTQKLMENKLGIYTDRVKTGEFADLGNPNRPMTDKEKDIIQAFVEETYETFTSKAAKDRNLDLDSLKSIASGRVWTGQQALSIGLIDKLGSLEDAIKMTAKMAKLKKDSYDVIYLPEAKNFLEEFLNNLSFMAQYSELKSIILYWKKLQNMDKIQARLAYDIKFK